MSDSDSNDDDQVKPSPSSPEQLITWEDWNKAFAEKSHQVPDGVREAKIVMNGPPGGGKTSFLGRLVTGAFQTDYVPTMVDRFMWTVPSDKSPQGAVTLGLWDTFGRADYDRLRPLVYPQTELMVLCFDVASRSMFDSMFDKYLPEVQHFIPNTPVVLLGLKSDLRDDTKVKALLAERDQTMPTRKEIESRAHKFNMRYFEVSAKDDADSVTQTIAAFAAIVADNASKAEKKKQQKQAPGLGGWFRRLFNNN